MTTAMRKSVCLEGRERLVSEGVEGSSQLYHHQSVGNIPYSREEAAALMVPRLHSTVI